MTIQCTVHHHDLYEDVRNGIPMARWLCPEPGCAHVVSAATLGLLADQGWCEANGMTAPGWQPYGFQVG